MKILCKQFFVPNNSEDTPYVVVELAYSMLEDEVREDWALVRDKDQEWILSRYYTEEGKTILISKVQQYVK